MDKISIIVPCFNEEESIDIFYKETMKTIKQIKNIKYEFIFVNDGSRDNTLNILRNLGKKDNCVRYISFSRNFGKEAAMLAGFEAATGDYVTTIDADLQQPPELLIKMYDMIKKGDIDCVATRSSSRKSYSKIRKFFTKNFYKIINRISDVEVVDGAKDYRLMKRKVVDAIIKMKEYNRFTKGIYGYVGFKTEWIEFDDRERVAGNSKWSFFSLFKYAMEGIIAFSTKPLIYATFIGILFLFISFVLLIIEIIKMIIYTKFIFDIIGILFIVFLVSGIQIFFIGIIGIYLSKLYLEIKNRPIYIVSETEKDNK